MAASMRFDLTAARRAWRAGLVALVAVPSVLILGLVPLPALAHKSRLSAWRATGTIRPASVWVAMPRCTAS